jgi:hypothetical protein
MHILKAYTRCRREINIVGDKFHSPVDLPSKKKTAEQFWKYE